jgi:hypothetical protein
MIRGQFSMDDDCPPIDGVFISRTTLSMKFRNCPLNFEMQLKLDMVKILEISQLFAKL